jgi:hypothetical protein
VALTLTSLTFVILGSGLIATNGVQARLDHGPGCLERLPSLGRIPGPYFGHPFFTAAVRPREPV